MDKKIQSNQKQNLSGKIFFLVFFLLIVGSVALTYYRIMVKRDYIISAQIDCDPAKEACFVSECDPESDSECADTPEDERTTYYKTIKKNAKNIPLCDAQKNECPEQLSCEPGEEECEEELCDESNVPEGESCNDPEQYLAENPPEECDCGTEEITIDNDADINKNADSTEEAIDETEVEKGDEGGSSCECSKNAEEESAASENDNESVNNIEEETAPQPY